MKVAAIIAFFLTIFVANFAFAGTIVYDVYNPDGTSHIWAMNDDGTNKTQLTFGNTKNNGPVCSPNGELIAFASEREGLGIYLYDINDKTIQKIYGHTVPYGPTGAGGLFFSKDSTKVYFYYGYQSGRGEYYYVPIDGSSIVPLTNFGLNTRAVDISPDGTKLVYSQQSGSNSPKQEIYTSEFYGGSVTKLTNNSIIDNGPKWSNDGSLILWRQRPHVGIAPVNLYVMNDDGSDQHALTTYSNSKVGGFDFSPDGTQIAYTVDINGIRDVFIVEMDGSNPINITDNNDNINSLDWTPHTILNGSPVANAGHGITISKCDQSTTVIEGTASDPDEDQLQYRWLQEGAVFQDWQDVGPSEEAYLNLATLDLFGYGAHTLTLEVSDGEYFHSNDMELTILSPTEVIAEVTDDLEEIIYNNPGTPLEDKLEDVLAKTQTALEELNKTPPDNQATVGNIEGAVGDLEAAVKDGILDPIEGTLLMDQLACSAWQLAVDAIKIAISQGGDPGVIEEAQNYLAEGEALTADEAYKDAVNKFKEAIAKAESAM